MLDIQKRTKKLYKNNKWKTDSYLLIIAMQEELGEIAGRYLSEHPVYKKVAKKPDTIPEEVGDLGNLILAFCNKMGFDFEKCVENTIKKKTKKKIA